MVPGSTPCWTASAPVYKKAVASLRSVATLGSSGGATSVLDGLSSCAMVQVTASPSAIVTVSTSVWAPPAHTQAPLVYPGIVLADKSYVPASKPAGLVAGLVPENP